MKGFEAKIVVVKKKNLEVTYIIYAHKDMLSKNGPRGYP